MRISGASSSRSRSRTSARSAAYQLNLPLQPTPAQFDLLPERDTQLELGGHIPVGDGDLGFRVWQKNANNLIDDTQVGVTLLHQDINYVLGRLSQEALNYSRPVAGNGRAYFSVAHVVSLNSGCETQLLAPCFGAGRLHAGRSRAKLEHRERRAFEQFPWRVVFGRRRVRQRSFLRPEP